MVLDVMVVCFAQCNIFLFETLYEIEQQCCCLCALLITHAPYIILFSANLLILYPSGLLSNSVNDIQFIIFLFVHNVVDSIFVLVQKNVLDDSIC